MPGEVEDEQIAASDVNESLDIEEIEVLSEFQESSSENSANNGVLVIHTHLSERDESVSDNEQDFMWSKMDSPPRSHPSAVKRQSLVNSCIQGAKKSRPQQPVIDDPSIEEPNAGPSQGTGQPRVEDSVDNGSAPAPSVDHLEEQVTLLKREKALIEAKYEGLVSILQNKVECPVCYDVPKKAPVFVCPNGHVVCRTCRQDNCPSCRASMLSGGTSVLALAVIENIPHSCEFQVHGCGVRCDLAQLARHQTVCRFRTVKCPNFSCQDKVPLPLLAEHSLRRCIHNGTFYESPLANCYNYIIPSEQEDQFDKRRNSTWRPDGITFDGRNFFFKITRKGKKQMWYFYVQMAGSETECSSYKATIHVYKTNVGADGRHSHRFIGDICPVDVASTERAADAGYCQNLTDSQMKKVFTEGSIRENERKYGFSVEVKIDKETLIAGEESPGNAVPGELARDRTVDHPGQPVVQDSCSRERGGFRIMRNRRATSPMPGSSGLSFSSRDAPVLPRVLLKKTAKRQKDVGSNGRPTGSRANMVFKQYTDSESSSADEGREGACKYCSGTFKESVIVRHVQECSRLRRASGVLERN